jgi:hypothetical protein
MTQINANPQAKSVCDIAMGIYCNNDPASSICTCIKSKTVANPNCIDSKCIDTGYKNASQIINSGDKCAQICTHLSFIDRTTIGDSEYEKWCSKYINGDDESGIIITWQLVALIMFVIIFILVILLLIYNMRYI